MKENVLCVLFCCCVVVNEDAVNTLTRKRETSYLYTGKCKNYEIAIEYIEPWSVT